MPLSESRSHLPAPSVRWAASSRRTRVLRLAMVLTIAALEVLMCGAAARGAGPVITEFPLARSSSTPLPSPVTAGPDGNLWFTAPPNRIGVMTMDGTLKTMITLSSTAILLGAYPNSIVTGPDGNVWFCETLAGRIGRLSPAGVYTEFALPTPDRAPVSITAGPDGALWFTEAVAGKIGRITTSGVLQEFPCRRTSGHWASRPGPTATYGS